ncbi:hypothetical protein NP233_g5926 [Leucocoprinus birnbaumii]|uniref:HTH CENPB-type domain-containing protein n=1 Tax=Leucocoprinus birnbaumii TaxID=56174 RepID=A0AAD5VS05_9AGAR|nr:hypothetical protein NP233_g5926 [Leucocoprinus birnbaumii]
MLPKLIHSYPFPPPPYGPPPTCSRQSIRRPHLQTSHLNAIMSESSWNTTYTCAAPSSYEQTTDPSSSMFPSISSRPQESYPSPASIPSPSRAVQQDSNVPQDQTITNAQDQQTNDCYSSYVDSQVDHEGRPLSGRLSRLEYRGQRRRDGMQSPYPRTNSALSPRHYSASYEGSASRPQSPVCSREDQYGMNVASTVPLMMQNQSYRPMTPSTAMTSTSVMSYPPSFDHQYSNHSQVGSTSHSYDHRPPSPALSTVSSRSDTGHRDTLDVARDSVDRDVTSPTRPKPKKAKLTNALRKEICLYQQSHPHQKQEEIAQRFGVERSTVSKILKEKKTWLNIEDGVAEPPRHRPPKHPKLEEEMLLWLEELSEAGDTITDAKIQKKALEIADELRKKYGTIGSEKGKDKDESFKASAGWIENFKRRHHVKGGVWHGRRKAEEPEVEDAPMVSQEPEVVHPVAVAEEQYVHHTQTEMSHPMDIEGHLDDLVVEDDLKGGPQARIKQRGHITF